MNDPNTVPLQSNTDLTLKVAHWNVRSIQGELKRDIIMEELNKIDESLDIVSLVETKLTSKLFKKNGKSF